MNPEQLDKLKKDLSKEKSARLRQLTQLRAQVCAWHITNFSSSFLTQVSSADEDLSLELDQAHRIKKTLLEEQGKIEYLRREHARLRKELEVYHSGKGWQSEAFISNTCKNIDILEYFSNVMHLFTASANGTLHVSQLPSILNLWILENDSHGVPSAITASMVEESLQHLKLNGEMEINCREFISLCDYLS